MSIQTNNDHVKMLTNLIDSIDNAFKTGNDDYTLIKLFTERYYLENLIREYVTPVAEKMRDPFLAEHFPDGNYILKKVLVCGGIGKSLLTELVCKLLPIHRKYPHVIESRSDGERIVFVNGNSVIDWVVSDGHDVYDYVGADCAIILVDLYCVQSPIYTIDFDISRMCGYVPTFAVGNLIEGKEKVNETDFSDWTYSEFNVSTSAEKILQFAGVL